jgi:hypothetical protein
MARRQGRRRVDNLVIEDIGDQRWQLRDLALKFSPKLIWISWRHRIIGRIETVFIDQNNTG